MSMRALPLAFDHGKCLLICPFFIVTTFSRPFLFFPPNHIFIKNINRPHCRPPKTKGARPGQLALSGGSSKTLGSRSRCLNHYRTGRPQWLKCPDAAFFPKGGDTGCGRALSFEGWEIRPAPHLQRTIQLPSL